MYEDLEEARWCCISTLVDAGLVPVHAQEEASIVSTSTGYRTLLARVSAATIRIN
jgi:hypothetical protein